MAGASGARRMGDAYFNFYLLAMHGGRSRTAAELGRLVQAAGFVGLRELATPIPLNETWHYSLGHWVEDDPAVGDGAFSSAGAFGFYPWVDAGRQFYGVLARSAADGGQPSMECGRLIRRAWLDGLAPAAR